MNRATALEMGQPTLKNLSEIQDQVKAMFETIHLVAIDQALIAGMLIPEAGEGKTVDEDREELRDIEAVLPELTEDDVKTITESLFQVTNSLLQGLSANLIKQEDAALVYTDLVSKLGNKIEPPEDDSVQASVKSIGRIVSTTKKLEDIAKQLAEKGIKIPVEA